MTKVLFLILCLTKAILCQYNLDFFINKALDNSPQIRNYNNLFLINNLQKQLDEAQNSAFQVSLTSNYLFAPYFNNNGHLISTNPDPKAIGYDAAITNGGLYSAQINVAKNIFNGGLMDILSKQRVIEGKSYENKTKEEKHTLRKQVTDQYLNSLQYLMLYKLSKEIVENLNNQLELTSSLVTQGFAKATDYLLLKIELKNDQISSDQMWQDYKSNLAQLYSLCGITDTQTVIIDSVALNYNPLAPHSKFLTQYNLDSLSAEIQQQIFETKYEPQVQLFFNAGLNAIELNDIQRKFGISAGLNFSLPILDGGQRNITRQQTVLAQKSISDYKSYFEKNISTQRKDAENRINSLEKNVEDFKSQINDYNNLLDISEKELQQGNLTVIDYLTLLKNYINIRKSYITTEINYQLEISNYNYWNW